MSYPKIDTVFDRDRTTGRVDPWRLRRAEFGVLQRWHLTEKIDGTNVRVVLSPTTPNDAPDPRCENCDGVGNMAMVMRQFDADTRSFDCPTCSTRPEPRVLILGRTDRAQVPDYLLDALRPMFPLDRLWATMHADDEPGEEPYAIVLFGEGYGPRIQGGGGGYRADPGFRLFDVKVGRKWLDWPNVEDIARKLGVGTAPALFSSITINDAEIYLRGRPSSVVAKLDGGTGRSVEGVVARTIPYVYDWRGDRIMWKLKTKDLAYP